VYLLGLALLVIGFLAQQLADAITFPRGVSPDAAGVIGGVSAVVIICLCLVAWYAWFRGRSGSIMILIGFIALTKGAGALVARLLVVMFLPHT
jgi:hypothetical protein